MMHPLFRVTPFDPHLLNMNCKRLEVGLLQSQDIFKVIVILNPLRFLKNVNGNFKSHVREYKENRSGSETSSLYKPKILTCILPIRSAKSRSPEIAINMEKRTSPG